MIQNRVLVIKKLMLRGCKLDFGCYIFYYVCLREDGYRMGGLLIRCKVHQPDLWSIRLDLHRDLPTVVCIKRTDWRLDNKNNNKTLTMFTQSLFLHMFAANTVFAVTSGVGFLNIHVATKYIEILLF